MRYHSGMIGLAVSRPTLEGQVRRWVLGLPNVRQIEGCDAIGPVASEDGRHIEGARVVRQSGGGAAEILTADLTVDAGGHRDLARGAGGGQGAAPVASTSRMIRSGDSADI